MSEYMEIEQYYQQLQQFQDHEIVDTKEKLPRLLEEWTTEAETFSHYNGTAGSMALFHILGQICKDLICIPKGNGRLDTRVHVFWCQTARTGKTTLWNFTGPVQKRVYNILNAKEGSTSNLDVLDVKEYTAASLLGGAIKVPNPNYVAPRRQNHAHNDDDDDDDDDWIGNDNDDDDIVEPREILIPKAGFLEGEGTFAADEFENSGVFKQSQYKEGVITHFQTFMNTLWGHNWVMTKGLQNMDELVKCECKRSLWGTTFPPENLTKVIAHKGVLQRMLPYIRNVPEEIILQMHLSQIAATGTIEDTQIPINQWADRIVKVYEGLEEQFKAVGRDPLKTIDWKNKADFNAAKLLEYRNMMKYISEQPREIQKIVRLWVMNLMNYVDILGVLCCVMEGPAMIKNKYVILPRHARQAATIIRVCYKSLIDWMHDSLRVNNYSFAASQKKKNSKIAELRTLFNRLVNDGNTMDIGETGNWVHKTVFREKLQKECGYSQPTFYRIWKEEEGQNLFDVRKVGKAEYIRLKEE